MPNDTGYLITPAERTTLLEGPLGAVLMLGADKTAGRLRPRAPAGTQGARLAGPHPPPRR
jgi:hypothetical protein